MSVAEYVSISLNILENDWANCYDYARVLNMPNHLLRLTSFWRCLGLWMCQGSEYDMVIYARAIETSEYVWIWLNMPQCLNMPQYALMSLKMPEHGWILLNISEYAWECLNKLFWLNLVSQYASSSYLFDRVWNML